MGHEKIWAYLGLYLTKISPKLKELNLTEVLNVLNGSSVASTETNTDMIGKMGLMSCSDKDIAIAWQKREIQSLLSSIYFARYRTGYYCLSTYIWP